MAEIEGEEPLTEPRGLAAVAVRGASLASVGYALTQIINLATYLVLARLLTPAEFGHFAAGTLIAGVGMTLGESGMLAALIQRRDRLEEAMNSALLATIGGGILFSLLTLATAPLVGLFFGSHETGVVAAAMSGWLLLRMVRIVPDAYLQRRFSFMRRVVVDPLSAVAFAAGTIVAGAAGLGVWALAIGTYASAVVGVLASWLFAGWRPRPRLATRTMWRELAGYGRHVAGSEIIRRVTVEVPVALLGRVSGPSALGQFSYATRVAMQPLGAVINAGGYVLLPVFARIAADRDRFRAAFLRALRWQSAVTFPTSALLIPLGVPAMVVVFGEQWRDAGYAVMALSGYCAALSLDSIASEAWKAVGRPDMLPRMHGLSLVLTVLFTVALGIPFGLVGVAIALTVSAFGVAAYAIWGVGQVVAIPLEAMLRELWPPTVASLAMGALLYGLEHGLVHSDTHGTVLGVLLLGLETALGALIYLGLLALLAPSTARELRDGGGKLAARLKARRARRSPRPADS